PVLRLRPTSVRRPRRATDELSELVEVDWQSGVAHFLRKPQFPPRSGDVEIENAMNVAWTLYLARAKRYDPRPAESTHEVPEFQHDILSCALRSLGYHLSRSAADVVRSHQDDGESHAERMLFELLDNGAAAAGLFLKDYGIQVEALEQPRHLLAKSSVVP